MRIGLVTIAPYLREQHVPGHDLSAVPHQRCKQVILSRRELDITSINQDFPSPKINRQGTNVNKWFYLGVKLCGMTQRHADACQDFVDSKRFGDIVVGPQVKRADLVVLSIFYGEHDDREIGLGSYLFTHLQSTHARQSQVEQDEVGALSCNLLERLLTGAYSVHLVAVSAQATL